MTSMQERSRSVSTSTRLTGRLGVTSIVFMVVAAAAPLTIFVTTPVNMLNGNGPGIAVSYVLGPLILLLFGVGFAAMSVHVKKSGAFYAYITAAIGRPVGVGAGFLAMLGYFIVQAGVYILLGFAMHSLLASFTGAEILPWWGWTIAAMLAVGFLGYFHVELGAKVLSVALVLEVLTILVLDTTILAKGGGPEGVQLAPFLSGGAVLWGSLPLGILFGVSVGMGFEATALFRDEARDPNRTIPRAIYTVIIAALVFYGFAVWAWMQAYGANGVMDAVAGDPDNITYMTAARFVGPAFEQVMNALAVTSMFAAVLAYHNMVTRYLHSMGHSILPRRLSWVHAKHGSPFISSFLALGIAAVLFALILASGIDPLAVFGWCIAVGTLSPLILFMFTSVAIIIFFRRNPALPVGVWKSVIAPALAFALFGSLAVVALLNFSTLSAANAGLSLILQLLPVVVFGGGVVVALIVKRLAPQRYAALNEQDAIEVRGEDPV
ncbi:APC family permease [Sciscionella marina]|uniref:APC family permease n=1 Tax=Sciscionella marina TaxID=508770 RepID=UPI00036FB20F|nr:APC family permease [Sciscionella marina]